MVLGSVVGLSVDSRDHIWISIAATSRRKKGTGGRANGAKPGGSPPLKPATSVPSRRFVRRRAAILELTWLQLFSSGEGGRRVPVADVDAWHHGRWQRQSVDDDEQGIRCDVHGQGNSAADRREGRAKAQEPELNRAAERSRLPNEVYGGRYGNRRVIGHATRATSGWGRTAEAPIRSRTVRYAAPCGSPPVHCASLAADACVRMRPREHRIQGSGRTEGRQGNAGEKEQPRRRVIFESRARTKASASVHFDGANHRIGRCCAIRLQWSATSAARPRYGPFYAPPK